MQKTTILKSLVDKKKRNVKSLSVLIDPDKIQNTRYIEDLIRLCEEDHVDFIFVGGSLLINNTLGDTVKYLKDHSKIPVVIFPGSNLHIENSADGVLFLSLISGRNPELLIGQHVVAAPVLKNSGLEILSTGYILVGNNNSTTVAHISQTSPIPNQKPEIAVCTAMAGEMLGMRLIYLDAGSGAQNEVQASMILQVSKSIAIPLIVGGGINTKQKAITAYQSGADVIVLGTQVEKNVNFISEVAKIRDKLNLIHS